ncbi:MAG: aminotransferase class IV [Proteobacteria bacterium]|jgi:branched-chain amino acid aminotransferase|nr:aminotransferase class IV [Pseudomonadota bacterium]MBP11629.1 aminotransferase class IV [Acidiferrobacteraceae bacterium]MDP7219388.1 aminotransferase class IV [Arenicellales bacterium]HCF73093.1 aminotransferase class IV [Gammaproteobacteria bacterium]HJP08683.1 aminotransferase class IV [Arenicellales bacterium]|tara:strand:+ start:535 stop:1449 length:915 start_codon:yes stop_codon:yes gene_type:complete
MTTGFYHFQDDARNAGIQIDINGQLFHRDRAMVSVFDSGFVLGDGIWEGLRVFNGRVAFFDEHMDRLFEGAKALDFELDLSRAQLSERIDRLLAANGMHDGVSIRLMVSRGVKSTPNQDPRVTIGGPTIVIIAEFKEPDPELLVRGLRIFTVHVRRGHPDVQDPRLNTHSKLNCITACIQATKAGFDEALMLDPHGFVATCNSTHFFIVRGNEVWTSTGDYCLTGITRANVINLCRNNAIPVFEKNFSLSQVYGAQEAFVTGTFGGLVPVIEVDGRSIGERRHGPMVKHLQSLYGELVDKVTRA